MPYVGQLQIPFRGRSQTGYKAARRIAERPDGRISKTQAYIAAVRAAGDHGLTNTEAADLLGVPVQTICSVSGAARQCGLVKRTGRERPGHYGAMNAVTVASDCWQDERDQEKGT